MSNHRPVNDPGPSWASIATGAGLTLAAVAASLFILWGPMDSRGLIGAGMGFLLAVLLVTQTLFRFSERMAAKDRIQRWEARQRAEAERAARMAPPVPPEPAVVDTAVIRLPEPEAAAYDPGPTVLNPAGWPVPVPQDNPAPEEPWRTDRTEVFRVGTADTTLTRLPAPGLDREEFLEVRPEPYPQTVDATDEVGTETQRLSWPPTHQQVGPSPAALRPINVPIFRTEVERAAWADRYALPPEVLPVQRDES